MSPIEEHALWKLHRDTRRAAQRAGHCARCSEALAFAETDRAEGLPPRTVELCDRCKQLTAKGAA